MKTLRHFWSLAAIPLASIFLALLCGSILIIVSGLATVGRLDFLLPIVAYEALLEGATGLSFLNVAADGSIALAFSIDPERAARALTSTIAAATPLILTGLAVGVGFKAGLFNIGGTGQVLVGGFTAAMVGASVAGAPVPVAVTIAVLAGAIGGAIYGFIPGALKAFTGAHEVVSTIMLNSLAALAIVGLVNDVFKIEGPTFARTADVGNAALPVLFGRNGTIGIFIALAMVAFSYVLIYRTTLGFEIRAVGVEPERCPLRRHEPTAPDHPDDEPLRDVRGPGWHDRDPDPRLLPRRVRNGHRVRRHHRRHARTWTPDRHPAGGPVARGHAGWCAGDADHG